ncbi:MAG: hypothetical protein IJN56_06850 [Clostridia bacterium]|nr:hypothetical protein [Clostridia bacterium]
MKQEVKRELLTIETIKKDIKRNCLNNYKLITIILLIFTIAILLTTNFFLSEFGDASDVIWPLIIIFGLDAFLIIKISTDLITVKNNSFVIKKDILISCGEQYQDTVYTLTRPMGSALTNLFSNNSKYHLNFKCYKTYFIPKGINYKYSKMFSMWEKGVYNYSVVNDEFYIVLTPEEKILAVYNAKLFEIESNCDLFSTN